MNPVHILRNIVNHRLHITMYNIVYNICATLNNPVCKVERNIVDNGLYNVVFNVLQTLHNIVINSLYNVTCNVMHCEFCTIFCATL